MKKEKHMCKQLGDAENAPEIDIAQLVAENVKDEGHMPRNQGCWGMHPL